MIDLSLNEVELTARKATRGAGLPWGIAEEVGKATRWLCHQNIDACAVLARWLLMMDSQDYRDWMPRVDESRWCARGGVLCPVFTGLALSDAPQILPDDQVILNQVAEPVLLSYFAGRVALRMSTTVVLEFGHNRIITNGQALGLTVNVDTADSKVIYSDVKLSTTLEAAQFQTQNSRAEAASSDLALLNSFAMRTYAPATEESRIKGAGAGLSDND